jgi:hypothetical protein
MTQEQQARMGQFEFDVRAVEMAMMCLRSKNYRTINPSLQFGV